MRVSSLGGWSMALLLSIVTLAAANSADSDARLIEAIKNADTAAVRALLPGSDVNARAGDGATALHWAVYKDDLATADLLIRSGAAVNAVNDLGVTPLWVASTNASAPMIATLLSAGADPDAAPPTGGTPLMLVSRTGNPEAVTQLLAHGADVNAKEGARDQTALMWAVAQREPEVVRLLLAAGADVDARSKISREVVMTCCPNFNGDTEGTIEVERGGFTPLMFAAREGDIESAGLLLAAGANVNDTTPPGTSAMVVAAHSGHGTLAALLLEHGADPNAARTGYTALHAAVLRSDLDLVKALLARGADPNARLTKGTPIRRGGGNGGNGISFNKSWIGATPFLLATRFLELDLMRVLAAGGADVAVPMEDGTTSVMAVLYSQRERIRAGTDTSEPLILEAARLATELGADVRAASRAGDTALHVAAKKKSTSLVQFLVDGGARVDVTNNSGRTPLVLAMTDFCGYGAGRILVVCGERGFGAYVVEGYNPVATLVADDSSTADLLRQLGAKGGRRLNMHDCDFYTPSGCLLGAK